MSENKPEKSDNDSLWVKLEAETIRDTQFYENLQSVSSPKQPKKKRKKHKKRHPWLFTRVILILLLLAYLFCQGYPRIKEAQSLIGSTAFTESFSSQTTRPI